MKNYLFRASLPVSPSAVQYFIPMTALLIGILAFAGLAVLALMKRPHIQGKDKGKK
jgi:hypothetical protein